MKRLALVAALLVAGSAQAELKKQPDGHYASPKRFMFEIKLGPYWPAIDSSAGVTGTPFQDLFTNQFTMPRPGVSPGVLTTLEFDWQFWQKFGSLAVGVSLGIYRKTTHEFLFPNNDPTLSCTVGSCTRSGDTTALTIVPAELLIIYRLDVLALRYRVPLVPYFKFGLAYGAWFIQNGAGGIPHVDINGQRLDGYGGSFGLGVHPGLAFMLDVIDPGTARVMDAELGINHTYLFCELNYLWLNGFGASNRLNVGSTAVNAGLGFEF
jgi:hypothetical protein